MTAADLKLLWRPLLWFGHIRGRQQQPQQRNDRDSGQMPAQPTPPPQRHEPAQGDFGELFWRDSVAKEWATKDQYGRALPLGPVAQCAGVQHTRACSLCATPAVQKRGPTRPPLPPLTYHYRTV